MKYFLCLLATALLLSGTAQAQSFPNPSTLSTGQGTPGSFDPIWTVSQWYSSSPPNPIGLTYTPALINNNCAPGSWVNPASLPPPANNGNWITGTTTSCSNNFNDGYLYFRLTLNLPTDCNGNSVTTAGNYVLYLDGYVDNQITDIFVNGASTGISGGGFSAGSQLSITLPGPWIQGTNYIDVQVYNFPNGGNNNPYGLLLVANTTASSTADGDADGIADISDQCPCTVGLAPSGCPPAAISGPTTLCAGQSTTLTATGGGTYLWSDGSTGTSITVTPGNNTPYSVTTTQPSGFTSTASVNVVVNQPPSPAISPATATVCAGNSITLTASGGTSYSWSNSGTSAAITVTPAGTTAYSVTVTDANNCTATMSRSVTVHSLPVPSISPASVAICAGTSTTLTASGGTSYSWSTSASTAAITVTPAGTTSYTVTVTDVNNCSATASRSVTVNTLPVASISPATVAVCAGSSVTLTAGGGTSYTWSTSATSAGISITPAGTTSYTVTVKDANNCTASASRSVTVNALPVAAISPASVAICAGTSTTLTASGGIGYSWSTTAASAAITVTPGGTTSYTVTVTDANSCSAVASRSVTVNSLPVATINPATVAVCAGSSATLTASGGAGYSWSTSATSAAITITPAGTTSYTVTVTDANNCSAAATRSVTVNALPIPSVTPSSIAICAGSSATVTAAGGTGYSWSTSAATAAITVSPVGTTSYTVTVADANNCTASASASVTVNQLPIPFITPATVAVCAGNSATLTASGGVTYIWSNTDNTAATTVTPAGTTSYTVTVADINNCTAAATRSVTVHTLPASSITPSAAAVCPGGSVSLTASGGTAYSWSTGDVTAAATVSPVSATTYYVTATDANNCSAATSASVSIYAAPTPVITPATIAICAGDAASLTASGGTGYSWSSGALTAAISVTPAGTTTYTATVTDANSCTASTTATVSVNPLPVAAISPATPAICAGSATSLTATGGTSYLWSSTAITASISVSPSTTASYSVTVTDANTCSATTSTTVSVNSLPSANISPAAIAICAGTSTTLTATGGTSYTWSTGGTGTTLNAVPSSTATYTVVATDANACTASATATVTVNALPTPSISASAPQICLGSSVTLTAAGGVSYLWNNGSTTSATTMSPASTTTYSVVATDANNCSASVSQSITVIPAMILSTSVTDVSCNGGSDGAVVLSVSSGQSPYTYLWSNTALTQNISGLTAGSMTVAVTDAAGCTATTGATISEPAPITTTATTKDPLCATLGDDGSIALTTSGGIAPYLYLWADGATASARQNLAPDTYAITVSDAQGCSVTTSATLAYTYDFTIEATPAATIELGDNTTLAYSVTGYSGTLSSRWTTDYGLSCTDCAAPVAAPGQTTRYQITVSNAQGCTASDTTTVIVIANYSIFIPNAFSPNGDGTNDYFEFYGNKKAVKFVNAEVFDRWGESVFRSNDINFRWDGTYRGATVEPGTLVWQINVTFIDGHSNAMQKGSLTVIR